MPSTPIPDAGRHATIEFFEEAAAHAKNAGQAVALVPTDLLALCKLARQSVRLDDDVRRLTLVARTIWMMLRRAVVR